MSEIPLIIGVLQSKMPLGDNFPSTWQVDDVLEAFSLSALTINAFWPPNHKKCFGFALLCLWNVQIQILNQPKRPS